MPLRGWNNLDFEQMLDWPSGVSRGQQNSSFSHHDGANSSLITQAGKLSPCRLQGIKTHTPGL